ncbi:MAG: ATP-binding protein [Elusimicrobia bacterium]|nr:ATP-binding protein [Elusimicrobiota bacterium]
MATGLKTAFFDLYWEIRSKRYYFLTAIFSILLNWAGNSFVYENSYRFLYFDMLGTFVAAMVLGTTWAVIVAIATAVLLSGVTSPHFIYLAVVNMSGAIFWGWLAESGNLALFSGKKNTNIASGVVMFIMFAGISAGIISAVFSSLIRNFISMDFPAYQPYSLYFAEWFKETFADFGTQHFAPLANYIADTFIEIPDKLLTVLCGIIICVSIFKFNITMLTKKYADALTENKTLWHKKFLESLGLVEIVILTALTSVYLLKVKRSSMSLFSANFVYEGGFLAHDFIVLGMLLLPVSFVFTCVVAKFLGAGGRNYFSPNIFKHSKNFSLTPDIKREIKSFLLWAGAFTFGIVLCYMFILTMLPDLSPVQYFHSVSQTPASPETFVWVFLLFVIFILIDNRNNNLTETLTLSSELIKKQTAETIYQSFDNQRQKLQVLELTWSQSTLELLRSARHDLVNELEKSKTGLDDLLTEVYDNVVKPYNVLILENQQAMRSYIEEITQGKLNRQSAQSLEDEIENSLNALKPKIESYVNIEFTRAANLSENSGVMTNKLFLIAFLNILNNSVFAAQKKIFEENYKAFISVSISVSDNKKYLVVKITDNAGGIPKDKLSKIYKAPVESSKGQRLGEGAVIAGSFISLLDGFITAENVNGETNTGLESAIYIPLYYGQDN